MESISTEIIIVLKSWW